MEAQRISQIARIAAAFQPSAYFVGNQDVPAEGLTDKTHKFPLALFIELLQAGAVISVNGQTGAVTIGKSSVGLGNVPNVDATARANHTGVQAIATITGLLDALNLRAMVEDLDALSAVVDTKAGQSSVDFIAGALTTKADAAETTASLATKATAVYVTDALSLKADLVGGVIPSSQIPAIAIVTFLGVAADEAAMLALLDDGDPPQSGDWCVRQDVPSAWVVVGDEPDELSSWVQIPFPQSPVLSVNSQTGVITLGKADIGLGSVENYGVASQAEAEAGTANNRFLTVERGFQLLRANERIIFNVVTGGVTSGFDLGAGNAGGYYRLEDVSGCTIALNPDGAAPYNFPDNCQFLFKVATPGAIVLSLGSGVVVNYDGTADLVEGDTFALVRVAANTWDFI